MQLIYLCILATSVLLAHSAEVHLGNLKQLTFGEYQNAEAYWSPDGQLLSFQSTRPPYKCDQIFRMNINNPSEQTLVSTGKGRTTCSYYTNDQKHIIYSSTHETMGPDCPPPPDPSKGYVWPLYNYEIYQVSLETGKLVALTANGAYNAESTICRVDGSILFTSTQDGDVELYRMNADGSNVTRLTYAAGYDGGAYFTTDCSKIVWRASRPTGEALAQYYNLLRQRLVAPSDLDLYIANADGTNPQRITHLNVASFAPYPFPSGQGVIFSSDYGNQQGVFNLWMVNLDGSGLQQVTDQSFFNSFPMFNPDGSLLAFCSARNGTTPAGLNVFLAHWIP